MNAFFLWRRSYNKLRLCRQLSDCYAQYLMCVHSLDMLLFLVLKKNMFNIFFFLNSTFCIVYCVDRRTMTYTEKVKISELN